MGQVLLQDPGEGRVVMPDRYPSRPREKWEASKSDTRKRGKEERKKKAV